MKATDTVSQDLTFGVFADPQYAELNPAIGRYYRDSAEKLAGCIETMNRLRPAFMIEMGDLIDNAKTPEGDLEAIQRIDGIYRRFAGPRYYVLGNHEMGTLSKEQFMRAVGMPGEHYAFDAGAFRCIVLDANFTKAMAPYNANNFSWTDAWIPPPQQEWLARELARSDKKAIVFVHQQLDDDYGSYGVMNACQVRKILEDSGRVIAVFQGHNHKGAFRKVNGIPYYTLHGMVEGKGLVNNAYAVVHVSRDGQVEVKGFGKQASYPAR
jgi:alkaline phosphatase